MFLKDFLKQKWAHSIEYLSHQIIVELKLLLSQDKCDEAANCRLTAWKMTFLVIVIQCMSTTILVLKPHGWI